MPAPQDRTALVASKDVNYINYITRHFQGQEMLAGSDGSLWLWSISDDVITEDEAICLIFGKYAAGSEAEAALKKHDTGSFTYGFFNHSNPVTAMFGEGVKMPEGPYTNKVSTSTICDFCNFMATCDYPNVSIELHKTSVTFQKDAS